MGIGINRVVLNPRAYLTPFFLLLLIHHLPLFLAYGLIDRPTGQHECKRVNDLFHWLDVAFGVHLAMAVLLVFSLAVTLCSSVYRVRKPESWVILFLFLLYVFNLVWTIYGEGAFPADTSGCLNDSEDLQDAADEVSNVQHFDFIVTVIVVATSTCSSYLCGVHTSADIIEAEKRWQRRCTWMFHACTCKSMQHDNDENIFESLGRILGKFFVVRYNDKHYEGLQFHDLMFCLGLVSKGQKEERKENREAEIAAIKHFPKDVEEARLRDLAFYGRLAIGIYGWPVFVWYSPMSVLNAFAFRSKKMAEQVIDHDNMLNGNRSSFINYTGIQQEDLLYLNCYNFVFSAPYSIVKDSKRRELIISVRGSLSFYDFMTDGLAEIVNMDPNELPDDVPDRQATSTHYGMLRTARSLFTDLQEGSRKKIFWDFALDNCVHGDPETNWKIVICGHSMGAGVGAILTVLLKRVFPTTQAYLYAPPMMFDPVTAAWSKSFMTTMVYGDDIVPRLSLKNVTRLRDEMSKDFNAVAAEKLFTVKYGKRKVDPKVLPPSTPTVATLEVLEEPLEATDITAATVSPSSEQPENGPPRLTGLLDMDFLKTGLPDDSIDVDVPGEIIHIITVNKARVCGCTVMLGGQELTYTLRDASYFRRIWVTPRAVQDHMVHHYDRDIRHLITNCLDFHLPEDQKIVEVNPEDELSDNDSEAAYEAYATSLSPNTVREVRADEVV
ncbi:hypothetical protein Poli38472_010500 [Pythium oligandrum]|uniref:sn-1-specific diacylglycerol lipase n=1 Tax=Pythium oligandrum TaxID=41045 RepID=A0A8K1FE85_PYTOL|nr:hypothetical protein Poli38472_010500 [Pythium oligandrum]|eukprot:TMW55618.1 hypothetical protein Poli38472_010500 [Pythium oligandrum]